MKKTQISNVIQEKVKKLLIYQTVDLDLAAKKSNLMKKNIVKCKITHKMMKKVNMLVSKIYIYKKKHLQLIMKNKLIMYLN